MAFRIGQHGGRSAADRRDQRVGRAKVDADRAGRLADLGADRVVLAMPPVTDIDEAKDMLSACAERLGLTPCH